jgi:hypothetical protein
MKSGVVGVSTLIVWFVIRVVGGVFVSVTGERMLNADMSVVVDDQNHPVPQAKHAACEGRKAEDEREGQAEQHLATVMVFHPRDKIKGG